MKTFFYLAAAYLAAVGLASFVANSATNSPTADTIAALPSVGTFLGANNPQTEGGINLVSAGVVFSLAYFNIV
jgi:hypothetical protein